MDEALLSEAIHHGFLFRKLTLGGEHDGTEPDYDRQKDTKHFPSHLNYRALLWKKTFYNLNDCKIQLFFF